MRSIEEREKVSVQLTGEDGNAFAIMGAVGAAMRKAGWSKEEREEYMTEAMSGDYDALLRTTMRYVEVS